MSEDSARGIDEGDSAREGGEADGRPMSRRRFLDFALGGTLVASGVVPGLLAFAYLRAPESTAHAATLDMGPVSDMPAGTGQVVPVGSTSVIVVRPGPEESVVAFVAACTHLGCIVTWNVGRKQIICPCHGAIFDLRGNVMGGPAPRPLPPFPASVQAGKIILGSA